jgi:hypothetical protein
MFTPPQSPARLPDPLSPLSTEELPVDKNAAESSVFPPPLSPHEFKRRIGRRTKFTVILVPLVLIMITLSTRWITHPAAFDIFVQPPAIVEWHAMTSSISNWTLHKRHPVLNVDVAARAATTASTGTVFPSALPSASASATQSPSGTSGPTVTLPTIPASPPTLPTPFPQPFDSSLQANFSNTACYNFFLNMTNTQPFRACRPFSLLLQSSGEFIDLQTNITTANAVQWGTCNTSTDEDQCVENMGWFASNLQTTCATDLGQRNTLAVNALQGLQAYALMRKTGCLADPTTNTYCYIEAANNSNPSDLYFYQLPLGIGVPSKATPTCSACTKAMLALYAGALAEPQAASLGTGLKKTYAAAANLAISGCGAAYATTASSGASIQASGPTLRLLIATTAVLVGTLTLMS